MSPRDAGTAGVPLVVDLDGTLTRTDTLHEQLIVLAKDRPLELLRLPVWLRAGRAGFKRRIADRVTLDASHLPYDADVLARIAQARAEGRRTVLASAADSRVATAIADHLGLFDEVIATTGERNLSGPAKRDALVERFGSQGFDYMANAEADKPVWAAARQALLCNGAPALADWLRREHPQPEVLATRSTPLAALIRAARPHQWVKNLLIFVPLVASHLTAPSAVAAAVLAFLLFGMASSSVYLLNDLLDLDADRRHPRKRERPFAAGRLSFATGAAAAGLLMLGALLGGLLLSPLFALVVLGYLVLTTSYSLWIKRFALVDVVVLAGLYTLRIVASGAATGIPLTLWLLAFAMFLFSSLAFAKRYAEVAELVRLNRTAAAGRGYLAGDQAVLMALGTASGMASVVTLALYVNSAGASGLYPSPQFLWFVCPILLYWIGWMWLAAQREVLTDDPIVFALRDRVSRVLIAASVIPIAAAIWL